MGPWKIVRSLSVPWALPDDPMGSTLPPPSPSQPHPQAGHEPYEGGVAEKGFTTRQSQNPKSSEWGGIYKKNFFGENWKSQLPPSVMREGKEKGCLPPTLRLESLGLPQSLIGMDPTVGDTQ